MKPSRNSDYSFNGDAGFQKYPHLPRKLHDGVFSSQSHVSN